MYDFHLCIKCVYGHLRYNVTHAQRSQKTYFNFGKWGQLQQRMYQDAMRWVRDYAASVFVIVVWILSLIMNVM